MLEDRIKILLPKDPNDDKTSSWKSGAAGGDEAALLLATYLICKNMQKHKGGKRKF